MKAWKVALAGIVGAGALGAFVPLQVHAQDQTHVIREETIDKEEHTVPPPATVEKTIEQHRSSTTNESGPLSDKSTVESHSERVKQRSDLNGEVRDTTRESYDSRKTVDR